MSLRSFKKSKETSRLTFVIINARAGDFFIVCNNSLLHPIKEFWCDRISIMYKEQPRECI